MKLHLGCGKRYIDGFYHVDALNYEHVDHVGSVTDLSQFSDQSIDLIYASHLLEHFSRVETANVLSEWFRVLKVGGVLRLAVPDFEKVVQVYLKNGKIDGLLGFLVGGQKDEYDYHKMVFDYGSLSDLLQNVGFKSVSAWDHRQTEHSNVDDYSQAYLPHLDKENGILMSLNVEAYK